MSQPSNSHSPVLDPDQNPALQTPWGSLQATLATQPSEKVSPETGVNSVEQQANQVMDDLFGDVERSLYDGSTLPVTWVEEAETATNSSNSLDLSSPGQLVAHPKSAGEKASEGSTPLVLKEAEDDIEVFPPALPVTKIPASSKTFDRLLLAIATLALVGTGAIWFALQTRLQQANAPIAAAPVATEPAVSQADRDFLNYMERALNVIDRKVEVRRQNEAIASNPPGQLPPLTVAGNPRASDRVLERIYVPVYQPPQSFNIPMVTVPAVPQPPIVSAQPPIAPAPSQVAPPRVAIAPPPAPAPTTTLMGVLELGNRSAALFEVNGTTRRIQIGENIGPTGWTLVAVRNQEAVIRRNGEVRSINVGQRF